MTTKLAPQDNANMAQADWQEVEAAKWSNGVLTGKRNTFTVTTTSGLGISVNTGDALVQGFGFWADATTTLTCATADPTNPRIDRVVLHADLSAHTATIILLTGTPAPSPAAPALTQTATVWEVALYQVRVNAAQTTLTGGSLTDERPYAQPNIGTGSITGAQIANATITGADIANATIPDGALVNAKVNKAGDTMSGGLTIAAGGLTVTGATSLDGAKITTDGAGNLSLANGLITALVGGGTLRGCQRFTGSGTGTYSHGLSITPGTVQVTAHVSGSQTQGYDSEGSTTVHVTCGAGLAFSGFAWVG